MGSGTAAGGVDTGPGVGVDAEASGTGVGVGVDIGIDALGAGRIAEPDNGWSEGAPAVSRLAEVETGNGVAVGGLAIDAVAADAVETGDFAAGKGSGFRAAAGAGATDAIVCRLSPIVWRLPIAADGGEDGGVAAAT